MAFDFKKFWKGIIFRKEPSAISYDATREGAVYNNNNTELRAQISGVDRKVLTDDGSGALPAINVDADTVTVSNLEVDNFKAGVLDIDISSVSASDDTLASAKAIKAYVDTQVAGKDDASEITYDNVTSGLTATDVQDAIDEVEGRVDTIEGATYVNSFNTRTGVVTAQASDYDANQVDYDNSTSGLTATDTQAAIDEVEGRVDTIEGQTYVNSFNSRTGAVSPAASDYDANQIDYDNASSGLAATDAQAAIDEIDTTLDSHTSASSGVHGVTGDVVGTTDTQDLSNKAIINPSRLDVKKDTLANLETYATTASDGQLCYATDVKQAYQIIDNALAPIGGSAGGLDVFYSEDFAVNNASSFVTGNNAIVGSGGSLAGTLTNETVSPISGDQSIKYTQASGSLNDYFLSEEIVLDDKQKGNFVKLTGWFNYDGNDSDIVAFLYDETNNVIADGREFEIQSTSVAGKFILIPFIGTNVNSVRVGFQVRTENIGAELVFDDLQISTDTTSSQEVLYTKTEVIDATGSGAFSGGLIRVSRVGDQVSISVDSVVTFNTSGTFKESGAGFVPAWARPVASTVRNSFTSGTASLTKDFRVESDGTLAFGFSSSQSDSGGDASISYPVNQPALSTNVVTQIDATNAITTKYLSSNVSTTGVMTDLTFSNLVVGKLYRVNLQAAMDVNGSADSGKVSVLHNGNTIGRVSVDAPTGGTGIQSGLTLDFVAEASTLTFVFDEGTNATLVGNGAASETFAQLIDTRAANVLALIPQYITAWEDWTPTGTWTTNTTYTGKKRKVGENMEYQVRVALSGAPNSATLTIDLPGGDVIDTSKFLFTQGGDTPSSVAGEISISDNGSNIYTGKITYIDTGTIGLKVSNTSLSYLVLSNVTQAVPMTFASGDLVELKFSVPLTRLSIG